jgi:acetamidase/formamidase
MATSFRNAIATSAFALCAFTSMAPAATVIHLASTPETVHRGILSPDLTPVLHIKSGDTVKIDTVSHAGLTDDPVGYFAKAGIAAKDVLPDVVAISKMPKPPAPPGGNAARGARGGAARILLPGYGGHVLTGPIYVDGAEPGDMLEVRILKVTPRVPYGVNGGKIIKYDVAKKMVNFSDDVHYPMRPFMGIMAVAPTKAISSKAPGTYGGNMDFEKLQAGSTLYLPVLVKGALFVTGDSHAGQGDGEVDGTAIEASMAPTLQFIVHKGEGKDMDMPYAEDAQNFYILGMDPDLGKALKNTIAETVKFLGTRYGLSPKDATIICSTILDFGLAQSVDVNLTMYGKVPKAYFAKKFPYWKA